jgi:hypothetical protein
MFLHRSSEPVGESNPTGYDGNVKKERRCTISKGLRARSRGPCGSNQPHNAREGSLIADCANAKVKASVAPLKIRHLVI